MQYCDYLIENQCISKDGIAAQVGINIVKEENWIYLLDGLQLGYSCVHFLSHSFKSAVLFCFISCRTVFRTILEKRFKPFGITRLFIRAPHLS